jgi:hypothetical protein
LSANVSRLIENIDRKIETGRAYTLAELHTLLALNQAELEDDIRAGCQDATTMIPDQLQQPILSF